MSLRSVKFGVIACAMLTVAACGKKDAAPSSSVPAPTPAPVAPAPVASVTTMETGKRLAATHRVSAVDSVFAPHDTMYVAVVTANTTPTSMLTAKWTFQDGQKVDSTTQTIARTDSTNSAAVTEFHVSKPKGWPAGKYTVEVMLNGTSAGSKTVEVKK